MKYVCLALTIPPLSTCTMHRHLPWKDSCFAMRRHTFTETGPHIYHMMWLQFRSPGVPLEAPVQSPALEFPSLRTSKAANRVFPAMMGERCKARGVQSWTPEPENPSCPCRPPQGLSAIALPPPKASSESYPSVSPPNRRRSASLSTPDCEDHRHIHLCSWNGPPPAPRPSTSSSFSGSLSQTGSS